MTAVCVVAKVDIRVLFQFPRVTGLAAVDHENTVRIRRN